MSDTKEIEIDETLQSEIVKNVIESDDFKEVLKNTASEAAKAAAEAVLAKFDVPEKKALGDGNKAPEVDEKDMPFGEAVHKALVKRYLGDNAGLVKDFPLLTQSPLAKMTKERRFYMGIKALADKDQEKVKELNAFAGEMYALKAYENGKFEDMKEKAGYANDAVSADGGALVPDPEFNTTVYENLPKYGVIFQDGNVQATDRTAVYALSLTGTIQFTNVAEAGAIAGTKLAFDRKETKLIKYAAIIPATTELTEDSIVDYWQIVTNEIARAYGLVSDTQVFTDPTNGIAYQTGVLTHAIAGGAGVDVSWDDLLTAEGQMEDTLDTSDFVWYMRKNTYFQLAQTKTSGSGQYLAADMLTGWRVDPNNPNTPWGTPVHFCRILPRAIDVVSGNEFLAVYGSLKNTNFYQKNGLALTMLTEAAITDASSATLNLATQDALAMRVVVRILHILPTGNTSKFVLVGINGVS